MKDETAPAAEEERLARAAAAGDGTAFAALHERYEQRAFNLAYRIVGSEADAAGAVQQGFLEVMRTLPQLDDGEPSIALNLFAATRSACHESMAGRHRPRDSETIVESTMPLGGGDPHREVREASMRLPEHQREALALRELEELSYDEIATIMETNPNSVAQLISRARINLHDELRGNVLASVAAPSPECERALPLIAMREDEQLEAASRDAAWLDAHLAGCHRCGLGVEVMQEAAASYSAWAPIAATPWLFKETMAKAAELTGADWSGEIAESPPGDRARAEPGRAGPPRRRLTLAAGLAALLLLAGVAAAVFTGDDQPAAPVDPAAGPAQGPSAASSEPGASAAKAGEGNSGAAKKKKAKAGRTGAGATAGGTAPAVTTAGETTSEPAPNSVQATAGGGAPSESPSRPSRSSGKTAVQPTRPISTSKPKPSATPAPAPDPAPTPAPVAEDPPPAEESPGRSSGKANPPGKPADRPPK